MSESEEMLARIEADLAATDDPDRQEMLRAHARRFQAIIKLRRRLKAQGPAGPTQGDIQEFLAMDREAKRLADKGGSRPDPDPPVALMISIGVMITLSLFAGLTLPMGDVPTVTIIVFGAVIGGGFYFLQRLGQKEWFSRYNAAMIRLGASDRRSNY